MNSKFLVFAGVLASQSPAVLYEVRSANHEFFVSRIERPFDGEDSVASLTINRSHLNEFRDELLKFCDRYWFDYKDYRQNKCRHKIDLSLLEVLASPGHVFTYKPQLGSSMAKALGAYYQRDKKTKDCTDGLRKRNKRPF